MQLLVTKNIDPDFRSRLLNLGCAVVEYPFIRKKALGYTLQNTSPNWIFTSSFAAKLAAKLPGGLATLRNKKLFCVGKKTAAVFSKNNQKVVKIAQNAADLANFIVKNHKNEAFSFFCGTLRRLEIETHLKQHNIKLDLHILYDTELQPKTFTNPFEGVVFYSPSAVKSFVQNNDFENKTAFCLGDTTAAEARKHTDQIRIAKRPEAAYLLIELKNYLNDQK